MFASSGAPERAILNYWTLKEVPSKVHMQLTSNTVFTRM
jgi:hypothetical protein